MRQLVNAGSSCWLQPRAAGTGQRAESAGAATPEPRLAGALDELLAVHQVLAQLQLSQVLALVQELGRDHSLRGERGGRKRTA